MIQPVTPINTTITINAAIMPVPPSKKNVRQ